MGLMNHEGLGMGLSCSHHAWPAGKNKHDETTHRSNTKDQSNVGSGQPPAVVAPLSIPPLLR